MHLLVGLGNPGTKYSGHRHNVGFMAVDAIAEVYKFGKEVQKFDGAIREGNIAGQKILCFKPLTFMNNSGRPVEQIAHFYKIPQPQIIVLHDELDLPLGKIRVKLGGGNGGHNGLRSLDQHITDNYWRVRIGIGHPGGPELVTGHVLNNFMRAEEPAVIKMLAAIAKHIPVLITEDEAKFMNKITLETKE